MLGSQESDTEWRFEGLCDGVGSAREPPLQRGTGAGCGTGESGGGTAWVFDEHAFTPTINRVANARAGDQVLTECEKFAVRMFTCLTTGCITQHGIASFEVVGCFTASAE